MGNNQWLGTEREDESMYPSASHSLEPAEFALFLPLILFNGFEYKRIHILPSVFSQI